MKEDLCSRLIWLQVIMVNWLWNGRLLPKIDNLSNCLELRVIEKYWLIINKREKIKTLCSDIKNLKISCKKASNTYDCNTERKLKIMGGHQSKRNLIRCPQEYIIFFEIFYLLTLMH